MSDIFVVSRRQSFCLLFHERRNPPVESDHRRNGCPRRSPLSRREVRKKKKTDGRGVGNSPPALCDVKRSGDGRERIPSHQRGHGWLRDNTMLHGTVVARNNERRCRAASRDRGETRTQPKSAHAARNSRAGRFDTRRRITASEVKYKLQRFVQQQRGLTTNSASQTRILR